MLPFLLLVAVFSPVVFVFAQEKILPGGQSATSARDLSLMGQVRAAFTSRKNLKTRHFLALELFSE